MDGFPTHCGTLVLISVTFLGNALRKVALSIMSKLENSKI